MNSQRIRLIMARCALVFFGMGVLGSVPAGLVAFTVLVRFFGAPSWEAEGTAMAVVLGFFFLCEVAALGLGIVGRRHLFGKVAMIGAAVVLLLSWALIAMWLIAIASGGFPPGL